MVVWRVASLAALALAFVRCAHVEPNGRTPSGGKLWTAAALHAKWARTEPDPIGFQETQFDSCEYPVAETKGRCGKRRLAVITFRIVCRDSEDTITEAARVSGPLASTAMRWKMAGQAGALRTNAEGYGQLLAISNESLESERLVLIAGRQFMGLSVGEVRELVVPRYWCSQSKV